MVKLFYNGGLEQMLILLDLDGNFGFWIESSRWLGPVVSPMQNLKMLVRRSCNEEINSKQTIKFYIFLVSATLYVDRLLRTPHPIPSKKTYAKRTNIGCIRAAALGITISMINIGFCHHHRYQNKTIQNIISQSWNRFNNVLVLSLYEIDNNHNVFLFSLISQWCMLTNSLSVKCKPIIVDFFSVHDK